MVIWFAVSIPLNEEKKNKDFIAHTLHLDLRGISAIDMWKVKKSTYLENKRFLLILDDVWNPMDLHTVNVKSGEGNCTKVLMSIHNKDMIERM